MECTAITYTNGTKEIQYGIQHLAKAKDIAVYSYVDLTEVELHRIRTATSENVQKVLTDIL